MSRFAQVGKIYSTIAVMLLNTLLLFLFIEMGYRLIQGEGLFSTPGIVEPPAGAPIEYALRIPYYQNMEGGAQLWEDTTEVTFHPKYRPYTTWRYGPFESEHLNINEDLIRVTPGAECSADDYRVFAFGGSTMWGFGSPDDGTIPAYLQAGLADRIETPVCVMNLSDIGYNSTQSLNQLITELQRGNVPDLVIFYDGANEVSAPFNNLGVPNAHFNQAYIGEIFEEGITRYVGLNKTGFALEFLSSNFYLLHSLSDGLYPVPIYNPEPPEDVPALADAITQVYLTNYRIVEQMSGDFGFEFGFFWQPVLSVSNKPLTEMEQEIRDSFLASAAFDQLYKETYERVATQAENYENLFYMGAALDEVTEQVWIDSNHLTPDGNAIVAEKILSLLQIPDELE